MKLHLLTITNGIFYLSLILLMAGGALLVWQGGFFDSFIASFRRFLRGVSKIEQIVQEAENRKVVNPYKRSYPLIKPLLTSGIILFLLSLILSYLFF